MADIDDSEALVCPVVKIVPKQDVPTHRVYRVSWVIDQKRKEEFFIARSWAEKHVNNLLEAAEMLKTNIDPMIGELEVQGE